jgi:hypothetical protein
MKLQVPLKCESQNLQGRATSTKSRKRKWQAGTKKTSEQSQLPEKLENCGQ